MKIVIKIGTSTLAHPTGHLNIRRVKEICKVVADIKGLYTADPHKDPNATLITEVSEITPELYTLAGSGGKQGTGGMVTKLDAAAICLKVGCDMVITNGDTPTCLYDIVEGKHIGTRFVAGKE